MNAYLKIHVYVILTSPGITNQPYIVFFNWSIQHSLGKLGVIWRQHCLTNHSLIFFKSVNITLTSLFFAGLHGSMRVKYNFSPDINSKLVEFATMVIETIDIVENMRLESVLQKYFTSSFRKGYISVDGVTMPMRFGDLQNDIDNFNMHEEDVWICSFPKTDTSKNFIVLGSVENYF
ncbi:hypothetical protein HUJ04_001539 [Dendroctonus ponderosae]|nr:hypothetical protein HUJ04_001539 [Dendroctonus ponderosae]KAH1017077.1 hypothetical protein HUJ05_007796 [Dendroctonus ponderosae]